MSVPLLGYETIRLLRRSTRTRIYEAERKCDGRRVLAKVFTLSDDSVEARVAHEFRVLAELDIEHVVDVLGLERAGNELVLLLDHVDGVNLARYAERGPLELDDFLTKALSLTATLALVHEHGVVHRDIKPSNILVEAKTGAIYLADFGISALLEDLRRQVYDPHIITGTLPYLSPEQTGRTHREVDARSDLYSLGVSFYELLTGQLPFVGNTPLELIHAHLARRPRPPLELRPQLPVSVSNLIMKLLEKAPEHRYQSARGLHADLEQIASHVRAGEPHASVELGRADYSTTLQLPRQLYGRELEQRVINEAFEAVITELDSHIVVISGAAGLGKSALIDSVETPLSARAAQVVLGKYEHGRGELPYAGLCRAFGALVDQLLAESNARLDAWRDQLLDALGPLAAVVLEHIPTLDLVLGPVNPAPELEPSAAQARLRRALIRLITGIAQHTPLVLVLDDMQWADHASLELVEALIHEVRAVPLLVIAAYRSDAVEVGRALTKLAEHERGVAIELV